MSAAHALLTGIVVVALTGCGADGGGTTSQAQSPGRAQSISDAYGPKYVSTDVTVQGKPHALVKGSEIRLTLRDGSLSTNAGCNSLYGAYELKADRLKVRGLSVTEVACEPALMQQEDWLAELLTSSPQVAADGDRLTLTSGDTVVSLIDVESAEPDLPLRNTTWLLESYGGSEPDDTVSSVPAGALSTLRLDQRRVAINYGCNAGSGTHALEGSTLRLGDIAMTRALCVDESFAALERAVADVLASGSAVDWRVDRDRLTLTGDGRTLTYRTR